MTKVPSSITVRLTRLDTLILAQALAFQRDALADDMTEPCATDETARMLAYSTVDQLAAKLGELGARAGWL